jgi:acetyltransferase
MENPHSDGLLAILTPQAMTDPTKTAEKLTAYAQTGKPIFASWMGGEDIVEGSNILNQANIPTFPYPDTAVRLFNYMWRYSYNLRAIYETPVLAADEDTDAPDRNLAEQILQNVRQANRTLLTEVESKQLLAAYRLPTVITKVAKTWEEAVSISEWIGYPTVLKLYSHTITHKTDVGGVKLNLKNADEVKNAYLAIANAVQPQDFDGVAVQPMISLEGYELIVGSSIDPQFGPVLLFGSGGQLVEVYRDRALALPPLNTTLARRMMEQTRIYTALQGVRGREPVNLGALEQLLVRFSQLVVEQPWIKEIDINPLLVSGDRLVALDARVVLHSNHIREEELPKLAIRPYPRQYITPWLLKDNTEVIIRPIRPEDEPLMIEFHRTLSEESIYLRYLHLIKLSQRIAHERLMRLCFIDYDREMALVVDYKNPHTGTHEILGVGRMSKSHDRQDAEFALLISDRYQSQGLGTELLQRLIQIAKDERLERLTADILADNGAMQKVCEKLGLKIYPTKDISVRRAEIIF